MHGGNSLQGVNPCASSSQVSKGALTGESPVEIGDRVPIAICTWEHEHNATNALALPLADVERHLLSLS